MSNTETTGNSRAQETAFIPLAVPDLRGNESAYLAQCVADNWVSSAGPFVAEFEKRIAELTGRRSAVATVNGTVALHLALIGCGVRPGDRVIVPDWTFAATANAVCHAGAVPMFVDVTEESWTIDPDQVAEALASPPDGQRVSAVIAVHTLGHPADMDRLRPLCASAGAPLIEDAAGAIGARYKNKPAGNFGEAAILSFNGNKTVTAGGGGMVVTDDEDRARRIRHLTTQARPGAAYVHDEIGFNFRMTNLNAAVGLAQIERLDELVAAKRRIAAAYDAAIEGRADLVPMPRAAWTESSCWLYSVLTASAADAESLISYLRQHRIEARPFWMSLSGQEPYARFPRLSTETSTFLSGRVVSLPSSCGLTAAQQDRVIDVLATWRGGDCGQAG